MKYIVNGKEYRGWEIYDLVDVFLIAGSAFCLGFFMGFI